MIIWNGIKLSLKKNSMHPSKIENALMVDHTLTISKFHFIIIIIVIISTVITIIVIIVIVIVIFVVTKNSFFFL